MSVFGQTLMFPIELWTQRIAFCRFSEQKSTKEEPLFLKGRGAVSMKKCVRCGSRFEDSVLKCPNCQLYLIKDTVGDTMQTGKDTFAHTSKASIQGTPPISSDNRRKRGRVEPVVGSGIPDAPPPISVNSGGGFRPSKETAKAPLDVPTDTGQSRLRNHRSLTVHRLLRPVFSALRYVFPVALILASILFIALNWDIVYEVIQCCLIGAIVGGILLTWISTVGHHYSIEAVIMGMIGGMVLACILTYNLFGVASQLGALLTALGPSIIMVIGILLLIRSLR